MLLLLSLEPGLPPSVSPLTPLQSTKPKLAKPDEYSRSNSLLAKAGRLPTLHNHSRKTWGRNTDWMESLAKNKATMPCLRWWWWWRRLELGEGWIEEEVRLLLLLLVFRSAGDGEVVFSFEPTIQCGRKVRGASGHHRPCKKRIWKGHHHASTIAGSSLAGWLAASPHTQTLAHRSFAIASRLARHAQPADATSTVRSGPASRSRASDCGLSRPSDSARSLPSDEKMAASPPLERVSIVAVRVAGGEDVASGRYWMPKQL